jgi:predicted component of type VI protein secretion system
MMGWVPEESEGPQQDNELEAMNDFSPMKVARTVQHA